ncbi:MAG: cytochrome c [Longimicrobiales bacterium]|nr:cytochrome c [Longimicrobiales bacterium]
MFAALAALVAFEVLVGAMPLSAEGGAPSTGMTSGPGGQADRRAVPILHVIPADTTGQGLYEAACANCHGVAGTGLSPVRLGLEAAPANFTDCNFASREPNGDWVAVAHQGGPVRGFSDAMPAFGDALTVGELEAVMGYIRTLCGDDDWPRGELNLPRAIFTEKAYPEDEAVFTADVTAEGATAVAGEVVYEERFGKRSQLEVVVPFGTRERAGGDGWTGGMGDIALGVKRDMYHSFEGGTIFSLAGEVILPTGDEDDGFGSGTVIFEPFASFGQILPAGAFAHAQVGLELPWDMDRAENEAFWRGALGRTWQSGPWGRAWSPMVEVLGARALESGAETSWDLVPQLHVTLNTRQHVMLNVGVVVPVTDSDVRPTRLMAFILWDWFDGGFFEGW